MRNSENPSLKKAFTESTGLSIRGISGVSGGCINECYKISTGKGNYFVKMNRRSDIFRKEALGLKLLKDTGSIYIPEVIGIQDEGDFSFLILECIEPGRRSSTFWEEFGRSLALLHKTSSAGFGLDHDNYIGSLVQRNSPENDWVKFFTGQRLEAQLGLAERSGKISAGDRSGFERLYKKLPEILPPAAPSLLHGDLWSGNFMVNSSGKPSLIDPAVYFGCNEVDLAMTRLFGGFDPGFYAAYFEYWPPEPGFEERADIYNLYPLLVHVNLFGGGYVSSVKSILKAYL